MRIQLKSPQYVNLAEIMLIQKELSSSMQGLLPGA